MPMPAASSFASPQNSVSALFGSRIEKSIQPSLCRSRCLCKSRTIGTDSVDPDTQLCRKDHLFKSSLKRSLLLQRKQLLLENFSKTHHNFKSPFLLLAHLHASTSKTFLML